jgi:hypothetical protein
LIEIDGEMMACPLLDHRRTGDRGKSNTGTRGRNMDTFSPEFSAYWLNEPTQAGERHGAEPAPAQQALSASQQAALEELAERVNAARSIV